jgi:hypothetical protein
MKSKFLLVALLCMAGLAAQGATLTFNTPAGSSVSDGPVNAAAVFVTADGTLTITLSNLLADPTSVGQNVSDLQFTLSSMTTPTLMSSSADEVPVNSDGTTTAGGTGIDTGWGFGSFGGGLILCVICSGGVTPPGGIQPAHTMIGPPDGSGVYTSANGSIAGNGPHNPFLSQTATFVIADTSITASTTVSDVVFSFGTTFGSDVPGEGGGGGGGAIPEPVSLILTGCGLAALTILRRRFA